MLVRYLASMGAAKIALWCYLIWYLVTVFNHFDPAPLLWLNSLGISVLIGIALVLSVGSRPFRPGVRWQTLRLFLIPFCVSSFAALIKGQGFVLVFPPRLSEQAASVGACAAFVAAVLVLKRTRRP